MWSEAAKEEARRCLGQGHPCSMNEKVDPCLCGLCGWRREDNNNTVLWMIHGKTKALTMTCMAFRSVPRFLLRPPLLSYAIPHARCSWNSLAHSCWPGIFLFLEWKQQWRGKESEKWEMSAGDKSQEENSTEGSEQVHAGVLSPCGCSRPKGGAIRCGTRRARRSLHARNWGTRILGRGNRLDEGPEVENLTSFRKRLRPVSGAVGEECGAAGICVLFHLCGKPSEGFKRERKLFRF